MQNNDDIVEELSKLNSSIIHDALRSEGFSDQTLPPEIRPLKYEKVLAGKIWTLSGELNEKAEIHDTLLSWTEFLSNAEPNSIVVCQPNNHSIALMGELSAETLKKRNIIGYIADGGCRDVTRIKNEIKFPVYCRFNTPKDIAGKWLTKSMGKKIYIENTPIDTGDYLIADEDGIVIIPKNIVRKIINKAKNDLNSEDKMRIAILNGENPKKAYLKYKKF